MKLQKLAITAFALSMSAAFAGGDKYHDKEKRASAEAGSNTHLSVSTSEPVSAPEKAMPEGAPAGYADKSASAEVTTAQGDTVQGQAATDATIAAPVATTESSGTNGNAPAGYSDKSAAATDKEGQKDTQKAQKQPDAGLGARAAAPAEPAAPAGHADKASAPAENAEQKDTQSGQQK